MPFELGLFLGAKRFGSKAQIARLRLFLTVVRFATELLCRIFQDSISRSTELLRKRRCDRFVTGLILLIADPPLSPAANSFTGNIGGS